MAPQYEEQLTVYLDFLGFSEVSNAADETLRTRVLQLLKSIASLRSEFAFESSQEERGTRFRFRPAISTFSDHIVISWPLAPFLADEGGGEGSGIRMLM